MGLAARMMGGGLSAGQAHAINGNRAVTVPAAGSAQATATALNSAVNYVTPVAASAGVILPNSSHSDDLWIYNAGANPLTIYPPSGGKINGQATNAGITLATATTIIIKKITDTIWVGLLSA